MNNPSGADADSSVQTLEHELGVETAARWAAVFLRATVLKDAKAQDYMKGAVDTNVEVVVSE